MNSAVEDIKARLNIVDLIGEYVRLQKSGSNWKGLCPFHHEKTPSFMVSEEKQIWHCFGCSKGGDAFGFITEIEGIEFKEALKLLAEKTGVELPKFSKSQVQETDDRKKILEILELSTKFYEKQLWDGAGKEKILGYLRKRGLKDSSITEFRLGYAPSGWRNLLDFLMKRGFDLKDAIKTGLLVQKSGNSQFAISNSGKENPKSQLPITGYYDRFRDRIMFPIMDVMGQVVGFSARVAPGGDESQAKYVNTPETAVYHKSKVLYGINKAKQEIKGKNSAIIVEGNMDVIAAHQAGIRNTVAVSGTALTEQQVDTLKRYSNKVKMLFDMDGAGEQATKRSAEICFQKDMNVSVVTLSGGKDAAEMVEKNPEEFKKAVENSTPAMEYFFQRYFGKLDKNKVEDKKNIASELLNIIKNFGNAIEKSHWIKKLADGLDVNENILLETFKRAQKRLKKRFSPEEEPEEPKNYKSRVEAIREKIAGLMLSDGEIWESVISDPSRSECFVGDNRFSVIFKKGPEVEYKFEELISSLDDEETKNFLQQLYFDAKYTREGEEVTDNDSKEQLDYYFHEIRKELNKERLKVLLRDIKKSEEEGDKDGKILLINEFNKLSQEIK